MNAMRPHSPALRVSLNGVRREFHGRPVLDSVDLAVEAGAFVALLGASGSGKTTLLRILAGLDGGYQGEVLVPQRRTVVFQEPRLVASMKVWRNVVVGAGRATRDEAMEALREVGLEHRADAWPVTLSGGEAQRVALARALRREPQLLLLDEPFAALDALTRLRMQRLVRELCERHRPSVLLVTHDVEEAIALADRIVVLREGRIAVDITPPAAISETGGEPYQHLKSTLLRELGVAHA